MKRSDTIKNVESKAYNINVSDFFGVDIVKDFGMFKKGDKRYVTLPIAMKLIRNGVASKNNDVVEAAKSAKIPTSYYTLKNDMQK